MANMFLNALTDFWNSAGTTYTAIRMNVTNANSSATSKLIDLLVGGTSKFSVDKNGAVVAASTISTTGALLPAVSDGAALGSTTFQWSDLYGASTFALNIGSGNWVGTHSSGIFTVSPGDLRVTTAGTNAASAVTVGGTQTLTAKTLTSPVITGGTINGTTIGSSTGAFTTLSASSTVSLSPASANVNMSPTGTGTVTIAPATAGTINRMSIGQTVAAAGAFTTVSGTTGTFSGGVSGTTGTFSVGSTAPAFMATNVGGPGAVDFGVGNTNTTGMFGSTAIGIRFAHNGSQVGAWDSTGLTLAGTLTVASTITGGLTTGTIAGSGSSNSLQVMSAGPSHGAYMTFHSPSNYAANLGLDVDGIFRVGGFSMGANSYALYHAGSGAISHNGGISSNGSITAGVHFYAGGGFVAQGATLTLYCDNGLAAPIQANSTSTTINGSLVATGTIGSGGSVSTNSHFYSATGGFIGAGSTVYLYCNNGAAAPIQANSTSVTITGSLVVTGVITASSDIRLKTDVKTIENALDKVNALRGVSFTKDDETSIGVIAQEVLDVVPEVVRQAEDGYYGVAYGNMIGLLIEAVKELTAEVRERAGR